MSVPVTSFFNNKGGVGKTTLVYHLAWMAAEIGTNVLAVDLDPQANLTAAFLDADRVEELWSDTGRQTIFGAISPLLEGIGDLKTVDTQNISTRLNLLAGDIQLASAEHDLGQEWPVALDGRPRAFRVITAIARAIQKAASDVGAQVVFVDVGPSLGAINRVAMVASDNVIVPLSPDLYSIQGLKNLGPTLRKWRSEWTERQDKGIQAELDFWLPNGAMKPIGYVVLQHGIRADRVVGAYDRWVRQAPQEYRESVLGVAGDYSSTTADDDHCLGLVKHFHSLIPMAQEARKPAFMLRSADGAIGAHQRAVSDAYLFFQELARRVLDRMLTTTDQQ